MCVSTFLYYEFHQVEFVRLSSLRSNGQVIRIVDERLQDPGRVPCSDLFQEYRGTQPLEQQEGPQHVSIVPLHQGKSDHLKPEED